MARKVFFSFHYQRDVFRVSQVRNSWVVRPGDSAQPFLDKAEWEKIQRLGDKAVEKWIEDQLFGTSVTVVLIGKETASREWVLHEIKRSHSLGKGIIGIYIHNIKDPRIGTDLKGNNPLDSLGVTSNGVWSPLSKIYPTYDWVDNNGYGNLEAWVEKAAKAAGK